MPEQCHEPFDLLISLTAGSDLGIENTNINTASGVTLDDTQKTLVGSVLDVGCDHFSSLYISLCGFSSLQADPR